MYNVKAVYGQCMVITMLILVSPQVSTNGIISFGEEFTQVTNTLFPSTLANVHYSYAIAPYWADIDARFQGEVWLETHIRDQDRTSADLLDMVSEFVRSQTANTGFTGDWMMVAKWDAVRMYSGAAANNNFDEVCSCCTLAKWCSLYIMNTACQ